MKTIERILLKLIIIQFIFLFAVQIVFHKFNVLPELKQLTQYEGVADNNFIEMLETFKSK